MACLCECGINVYGRVLWVTTVRKKQRECMRLHMDSLANPYRSKIGATKIVMGEGKLEYFNHVLIMWKIQVKKKKEYDKVLQTCLKMCTMGHLCRNIMQQHQYGMFVEKKKKKWLLKKISRSKKKQKTKRRCLFKNWSNYVERMNIMTIRLSDELIINTKFTL